MNLLGFYKFSVTEQNMKSINKLLKERKSGKISTIAKIAIPVAGVIAAKKLWDKKGASALETTR